ncbi:MAG: hypothetical protein AAFQ51_07350 [Pseudomonadota bacterium]
MDGPSGEEMESAPPSPDPRARWRDAALLLPLVGLLLFLPPLISVFFSTRPVLGVPLIVAYVFGAWLALICLTAWLSRRLTDTDGDP